MIYLILDAVRSEHMDTNSPVYNELNKAWKVTCKVLFGEEIGELKEYEDYLLEYTGNPNIKSSIISGKPVSLAFENYCKTARFISLDEIEFTKRFEPLNINEIKDLDSIIEALNERFVYAGNIILGNSKFIEHSSNITNSFYIYKSFIVDNSKYAAYSKLLRYSQYSFGSNGAFQNFVIRCCLTADSQRCFESFYTVNSTDIFYSANIESCSNCLFSFNIKGKRNAIGNLEIPKDKYIDLKKKLIKEIIDEFKSKKHPLSLLDLLSTLPPAYLDFEKHEEIFDIKPVEEAFKNTFRIVLKKIPEGNLEDYKNFLLKNLPEFLNLKDTASKQDVLTFDFYIGGKERILKAKHRVIDWKDSLVLMENPPTLAIDEIEKISLNDPSLLSKIAFISLTFIGGKNKNVGKPVIASRDSFDCYYGDYAVSKECAFSVWPRQSSNIFGGKFIFDSNFCINSHNSTNLMRAFEVDGCTNCSDLYFSHNCENVNDSMFCFNVKNLNHAIGNATLSQDQYIKVKESLIGQMADEIIKTKQLRYDIFNIGCGKK